MALRASAMRARGGYERAPPVRPNGMRLLLCLLAVGLWAPSVSAQPALEAPLTRVLAGAVGADGRVDYRRIQRAHRADLDAALAAVAAQDPAALHSDDARLAFALNAYNAHVLDQIAAGRVRTLGTPAARDALYDAPLAIAGQQLSLNQLEHGVLRRQRSPAIPAAARALRPRAVDYRVHVGLNCGAASCPPLPRRAFSAATVDRQLGAAWRAFVNDNEHVAARRNGGVRLSSLLDWFGADFERGGVTLGDRLLAAMSADRPAYRLLRQRLAGKSAAQLKADRRTSYRYDWSINRR